MGYPLPFGMTDIVCSRMSPMRFPNWALPRYGSEKRNNTAYQNFPIGEFYAHVIYVPHWLTNLAAWVIFAIVWRKTKTNPFGHCTKCNYNLTGNETGTCPECGTVINESHTIPEKAPVGAARK